MPFPYNIKGDYTNQPTVFKLTFGRKFFIYKGKELGHAVMTLCNDIERFLVKGGVPKPDHMLAAVIDHIQNSTAKARVLVCQAEVIKQTDDVAELLEAEKLTLEKVCGSKKCLNMTCEQHIPKWIQAELDAAQNKPITDTPAPAEIPVPQNKPKSAVEKLETTSAANSAKIEALKKLMNKKK